MHCKNCNHLLKEVQKYCDNCGAKIIRNRLAPKVLAQQVNDEFLSIDNRFLRTFIDLFKKPEVVINGYINGTRKKYVEVLHYFAISLTLAGIQVFLLTTFFEDALELDSELLKNIENMPGQKDNPMAGIGNDFFTKYQSLMYIIGVPISGFASWFVYFILGNKRFNFTEHLVLNLYYSAQIIIVTSVLSILFFLFGLNYLVVSSLIILPTFLYLGYVLNRVFKESFWETFAKFLLITLIYFFIYFIIMMVFIVVMVVLDLMKS